MVANPHSQTATFCLSSAGLLFFSHARMNYDDFVDDGDDEEDGDDDEEEEDEDDM